MCRAFVDTAMLKKRRQRVFDQLGGFSQQGAVCTILGKKSGFSGPTELRLLVWKLNPVGDQLAEIQVSFSTSAWHMWDMDGLVIAWFVFWATKCSVLFQTSYVKSRKQLTFFFFVISVCIRYKLLCKPSLYVCSIRLVLSSFCRGLSEGQEKDARSPKKSSTRPDQQRFPATNRILCLSLKNGVGLLLLFLEV